ncbi:MAG: hypothetical protein JST12_16800 [Armatimonadetes bacterium]|nr:hypothetical protein [Armatimonadota bacterium]
MLGFYHAGEAMRRFKPKSSPSPFLPRFMRKPEPPKSDTPKLPDDLVQIASSVNEASKHVAGFFAAFLLVTTYLVISAAGTTDLDLLYESPLQLPILNVQVPLKFFYIWFPVIYVILHFNLFVHVRMLESQVNQLVAAIDRHQENDPSFKEGEFGRRTEELVFPFFINRIFFPNRGEVAWFQTMIRLMFTVTAIWIPLIALGFTQYKFLPYHSPEVTWIHRSLIFLDCLVLFIGWVVDVRKRRRTFFLYRLSQFALSWSLAVAIYISVLALTFPGEAIDSPKPAWWGLHRNLFIQGAVIGKDLPSFRDFASSDDFEQRWLKKASALSLDNRDLSYARFEDCKILKVSIKHANLTGASFIGNTIRNSIVDPLDVGTGAQAVIERNKWKSSVLSIGLNSTKIVDDVFNDCQISTKCPTILRPNSTPFVLQTNACSFLNCKLDISCDEWDASVCEFYKCRGPVSATTIKATFCSFLKGPPYEPKNTIAIHSGEELRKLPTSTINPLHPVDPFNSDDPW